MWEKRDCILKEAGFRQPNPTPWLCQEKHWRQNGPITRLILGFHNFITPKEGIENSSTSFYQLLGMTAERSTCLVVVGGERYSEISGTLGHY